MTTTVTASRWSACSADVRDEHGRGIGRIDWDDLVRGSRFVAGVIGIGVVGTFDTVALAQEAIEAAETERRTHEGEPPLPPAMQKPRSTLRPSELASNSVVVVDESGHDIGSVVRSTDPHDPRGEDVYVAYDSEGLLATYISEVTAQLAVERSTAALRAGLPRPTA